MTDQRFRQLATQIKNGDNQGLEYVFAETSRYCVRTLIKKTNCNLADAEDVYMDAILIFRENILSDKLQYLSNIRTYVFGICWNVWRELNRAHAKWLLGEGEVERQLAIHLKPEDEDLSADAKANMQQQIKQVQTALAMLGEKCQKLLKFVYVEKRPQKEIATLMDFASPNVVKVTRHRCYQQWLKKMKQAEG